MDLTGWVQVAVVLILIWTLLVIVLVIVGQRLLARELALLLPNLVRLFTGLLRDPRVPLPAKVILGLASLWLASPIDLIPDSIPVRLYLATESTSKVSFNLLCPEHKSRIKNKRWCVEGDHEVAWSEVVRGYEYEKGSYVELTDEDLEKLPLRSSKAIDISGFVKKSDIAEELYIQSAYYIEPEKAAAKPYALLKKTLEKTGRVAIAKFALRDRERLVSIGGHDGALVLNTLHWPDEIRSTEDLDIDNPSVSPAELKMAENLVNMMATKFEPDEYKDEYKKALVELVE